MFTVLLLLALPLLLVVRPIVLFCALLVGFLPGLVAQAGPIQVDLNQELLAAIAGMVISLVCSYMPGIAPKYNALDDDWKRLIMLILMLLTTITIMGLGCGGLIGGVDCTQNGIVHAFLTFAAAALANKGTHDYSPRVGYKAKVKTAE